MWNADQLPLLASLHHKCAAAQVSYSIHWNEHDDSYYVAIQSPSPVERYVSRDYSCLAFCIEGALTHLESLKLC